MLRRETLGLADEARVDPRETREPEIGRAERDQLLGPGRGGELELGVEREDVEPPVEPALLRDDLAQPLTAGAHEHPAALWLHPDELGNEVWAHSREDLDDACLVPEQRGVRLEPEVAGRGRHTHGRRPRADVRLLDRARPAGAQTAEALLDPLVRLGEPGASRPVEHGKKVVGSPPPVSRLSAEHEGSVNGVKLP